MATEKMTGSIYYWNEEKQFGFIEQRIPSGAGFILKQFYLHKSRIEFTTCDVIKAGCFARFSVSNRALRFPADKPFAETVEIYSSEDEADILLAVEDLKTRQAAKEINDALKGDKQ